MVLLHLLLYVDFVSFLFVVVDYSFHRFKNVLNHLLLILVAI